MILWRRPIWLSAGIWAKYILIFVKQLENYYFRTLYIKVGPMLIVHRCHHKSFKTWIWFYVYGCGYAMTFENQKYKSVVANAKVKRSCWSNEWKLTDETPTLSCFEQFTPLQQALPPTHPPLLFLWHVDHFLFHWNHYRWKWKTTCQLLLLLFLSSRFWRPGIRVPLSILSIETTE